MPADLPASEFGGKVQPNTLFPPGAPKPSKSKPTTGPADGYEKLRLLYNTGQTEDLTRRLDNGEVMTGVLPIKEQIKARRDEGVDI